MIDIAGVEYAKLSQLKMGDKVIIDAGFTCMKSGCTKFVCSDRKSGKLFLSCDEGEHFLEGQLGDDDDSLIGVYKV